MPQILHTWTSAIGTALPLDPKQIFHPGDSIQFNVIHTADPGEREGRYVVTYFHEHLGLSLVAWDVPQFELLWPVRLNYDSPLTPYDGMGPYLDYWSMPQFGDAPDRFSPDSRIDGLRTLRQHASLLNVKGYWRFTAFVQATDENHERHFDVMEWNYQLREADLM